MESQAHTRGYSGGRGRGYRMLNPLISYCAEQLDAARRQNHGSAFSSKVSFDSAGT